MRKGCEQEHEKLCALLTDSYSRYRRITHVGSVVV